MPQKIIIDTDPGVDDVLAVLFALASPEVDVRLISIVFGNTHASIAHSNLLKIYHVLAQEVAAFPEAAERYARLKPDGKDMGKTVLALGEDEPIGGDKAVAAYFHGQDGLSNITVSHPHFTPPARKPEDIHAHLETSDKSAAQNILDLLRSEPANTVSIVALGPLTNLAHALRQDPTSFARVHTVIWMGGAIDRSGNSSPVAEFNCFADPYAADQILSAVKAGQFRLVMAPLDITTPHLIPFNDLIHSSYPDHPDPSIPPLQQFTSAMLGRVRGLQAGFGLPDAMEMHDPVAVWYAIAHAGLSLRKDDENTNEGPGSSGRALQLAPGWEVKKREFKIERTGEHTRGMCVVDRRGTGEEGEDRMKSDRLKGQEVKATKKDKDEVEKHLPQVIVDTPGSEELRRLLLQRVFGMSV